MANLHGNNDYHIQLKQGLAANVAATATVNQAVTGEPAYTTDTKVLYIFNGTNFIPASSVLPFVQKTANYTLTVGDYTVEVTSGTNTQTLHTAAGYTGMIKQINNSGTGAVAVACDGTETINGSATQTLYQWESITVQSNGTNWIIL